MEKSFKGTIKNATFVHLHDDAWWVEGNIYGDTVGRFPDGTFIHTSQVVAVVGSEIETLNSRYSVEWSANPVAL